MYKEDIIKLISDLLGDKFVISCLSCNISRDDRGLKMTEDSYSIHLHRLEYDQLNSLYNELNNQESWYERFCKEKSGRG